MSRLAAAVRRAQGYLGFYGLRAFLRRLIQVWVWLPRLFGGPLEAAAPILPPALLPAKPRYPLGVNVVGYLASEKGLGEAGRSMVRALKTTDLPVALSSVDAPGARNRENGIGLISNRNPFAVNLICLNGSEIPQLAFERGSGFFANRYNIGLWHWELEQFPPAWLDSFAYLDEVWVPTDFLLHVVSSVSPVPVVKVPLSIAPPLEPNRATGRVALGLPTDRFLFLSVFDLHGIVERKNPLGLIEAFKAAFNDDDDVCLVLKCANGEVVSQYKRKLLAAIGDRGNIQLIDKLLDNDAMEALYDACDCYVSLHRGEGFGLPLAFAMRAGKPVVATGFSGNLDFMNAANSYLVDYALEPIGRDYPPYRAEWLWAEPSHDDAVAQLRRVYNCSEEAAEKGSQARRTIAAQYSPAAVGALIRQRIQTLVDLGRLP